METAVEATGGNGAVRPWLTYMTWEGSLATVFITITSGAFLTGLALHLGANDFEIGLLVAIPFLLQVIQLVSALLVDQTGKRKEITVWSSFAGRQVWWLVVPILFLTGDWRLKALIGIVVFSNVAMMTATAGWLSWITDLVPDQIRGRYFGRRNVAVAISTVTVTLLGGIILDKFRFMQKESIGFAVILGAGCLFALAAVTLLNHVPDRTAKINKEAVNWAYITRPLRNANFRHLIRIFIAWNLAIGIAAPFFAAHMLTNLQMSFTQIAIYSTEYAIAAILLNRAWGKLIDRFGCKPIIALCAFGIALIPMLWWLPRQGYIWILWFEAAYSGVLWAGFNLAAFNIPIANSPKEERTVYLAMFAVLTGLAFFGSSIVGGLLAKSWVHIHWPMGSQTIVNYHLLFAASSLLRLLAAIFVLTFHEPREKGLPVVINFMGDSVLRWLSIGRQIFPDPSNVNKR